MTAIAPAGLKLIIKQAVGSCGDNVIKTNFFVLYHLNADNKIVTCQNGTYVAEPDPY
jgi:hypothetical protein